MVYTELKAYTRCVKCGKVIAVTHQYETDKGFGYYTANEDCRFKDKWGYFRNFCKDCMK